MSFRRLAAAAVILLAAVYLKFTLPSFGEDLLPAVQRAIAAEQAVIPIPDDASKWLIRR